MPIIPERDIVNLVLAPTGRDSEIACSLLVEAGFRAISVGNLSDLLEHMSENTGLVIVTEEAVRDADLRSMANWIKSQPSWSDIPFIVLTRRDGGPERNPAAARLSEVLGNVSFIERPFHATTFISVSRAAMRGRRRQYEARARIEALDEGERRLATALEAGRLGSWELDVSKWELKTSTIFRSIFGRGSDDTFTYNDLIASIHPDDRQSMKDAVATTIETGSDYATDYRVVWPDGSLHWVEIRAQLYRAQSGHGVKLIGVSADITNRRNAEVHQRRLNEILEERVAGRTKELEQAHEVMLAEVAQRQKAEDHLRQSQKLEAIGQLTGGVAHDFNNLLMAVLANLELLGKAVDTDPRLSRLVEGALQGARRGASLTQRLLAFARRQDLQVKAVDLRQLVQDMQDLLRRSVGPEVTLEINSCDCLPPVLADSNQIELALLNLVVNSRDAMPTGGSIRISLAERDVENGDSGISKGRYIVLSVEDTGTGMDAETLAKAVEPFFSTKELGKGTGLGLSMIHGLALQLGGKFSLESTVGTGTIAHLWIPMAPAGTAYSADVLPTATAPTSEQVSKRVLLVDDDALIAMSSADMIMDLGHDVVEVHSGAEAIEVLKGETSFDLMITDYSMPGMNGGELIIRAKSLRPDLSVLLATGYADLPAGVEVDAPRLSKPYTQAQLAAEIAKI